MIDKPIARATAPFMVAAPRPWRVRTAGSSQDLASLAECRSRPRSDEVCAKRVIAKDEFRRLICKSAGR